MMRLKQTLKTAALVALPAILGGCANDEMPVSPDDIRYLGTTFDQVTGERFALIRFEHPTNDAPSHILAFDALTLTEACETAWNKPVLDSKKDFLEKRNEIYKQAHKDVLGTECTP